MSAIVQFRTKDQAGEPAEATLLEAVMEASREGLAIIEGGRVLHANDAFARTFGYREGLDLKGLPLQQLIPESLFCFGSDTGPVTQPSSARCAAVRRDGTEIEILAVSTFFRAAQREFQVVNFREGHADENPQPHAAALPGSGADEQPAEPMESREIEARGLETMGRVVGSVAHDFNNLLTGILLYCDLLAGGLDPGSPLRGYVEEIRKAGGHSAALIQQLFSTAQARVEECGAYCWSEVISGMKNFLSRMLGEQTELVMELDPRAARVSLSESAMRQIVLNLLLNARDAMPAGGVITVSARNCVDGVDTPSELLDGYVELSVADTGGGMDDATRARACEPFFTTKTAGVGNGLGLATVQRIVGAANGSLEVQSEPSQGTRIMIRLPQAHLPHLQLTEHQPGREPQHSEKQIRA